MTTKQPFQIRSLKMRTVRTDIGATRAASTAAWTVTLETPAQTVKNAARPVHVGFKRPLNLTNVNRALRRGRDPVPNATANEGELETA